MVRNEDGRAQGWIALDPSKRQIYFIFCGDYNSVSPSLFLKLDVGLFSLVRLEVDTRLETIHFKCLVDTAFGIQI